MQKPSPRILAPIIGLVIVITLFFIFGGGKPYEICHDGIVYLKIDRGLTAKIDSDGKPFTCQ